MKDLIKTLSSENQVRVALFAAELALPILESYHPEDDRPREAIEAEKRTASYAVAAASCAAGYTVDTVDAACGAVRYAVVAGVDVETIINHIKRLQKRNCHEHI